MFFISFLATIFAPTMLITSICMHKLQTDSCTSCLGHSRSNEESAMFEKSFSTTILPQSPSSSKNLEFCVGLLITFVSKAFTYYKRKCTVWKPDQCVLYKRFAGLWQIVKYRRLRISVRVLFDSIYQTKPKLHQEQSLHAC